MGYAKERAKLEKLLVKLVGVNMYNEKSVAILVDTHEQYSHTVRILKNKEPETFTGLYTTELEQIKQGRKVLKEADGLENLQNSFVAYKDILVKAIEKGIQTTHESL